MGVTGTRPELLKRVLNIICILLKLLASNVHVDSCTIFVQTPSHAGYV